MVALRGLVLSHSKILTMRATPSVNSMAMNGRGARSRFVKIVLQHPQAVATELVVALGVAWVVVAALPVEVVLGAVVLLEVGLGVVGASVVVITVVLPLAMSLLPPLQVRSLRQTLSQTTPRQEESVARPSTSVM